MDTIHSTSGAVYAIICSHKVHTLEGREGGEGGREGREVQPPSSYASCCANVLEAVCTNKPQGKYPKQTMHYSKAKVHTCSTCYTLPPSLPSLSLPSLPSLPPSGSQESYLSLANTLISAQTDPQNQTRLVEAFSLLTPPSLPLDSKRTSKVTFRKNLEQFLPFVKGFLCYK